MNSFKSIISQQKSSQLTTALVSIVIAIAILSSFSVVGLFDSQRIAEGMPAIGILVKEMVPPNFSRWQEWLIPLRDSVAMSIAGTAIAVIISVPLSIFAARTTTPNKLIYSFSRLLLNCLRSVPELIMGIIFVAAVGFGQLPGALALGLHSVGMVGKFYGESIELLDKDPIEAITSTGATRFQVVTRCILPLVFPQMADVGLYRWEYNFRASLVVGAVGAGGLGLEIVSSLRIMNYQEVLALLMVVLIMVTIVDSLSTALRKRVSS